MEEISQVLSLVEEYTRDSLLMEKDFSEQLRDILFAAPAVEESKKRVRWVDEKSPENAALTEVLMIKREPPEADELGIENDRPQRKRILKAVNSNATQFKQELEHDPLQQMLTTGSPTGPNGRSVKSEEASSDSCEQAVASLKSATIAGTKKGSRKKKTTAEKPIKVEPSSTPSHAEHGQQQPMIKIESDMPTVDPSLISSDDVAPAKTGSQIKKNNDKHIKLEPGSSPMGKRTRRGQKEIMKCEEISIDKKAVENLDQLTVSNSVTPKANPEGKVFEPDTSMSSVDTVDRSIGSKTFVIVNESINDTIPLAQTPGFCSKTFVVSTEEALSREHTGLPTDLEFSTPSVTVNSTKTSKLPKFLENCKMLPRNWVLEKAVGSSIGNSVAPTTGNAVASTNKTAAVGSATKNAVGSTNRNAVGSATKNAVGCCTRSAFGSTYRNAVGSATKNAVGSTDRISKKPLHSTSTKEIISISGKIAVSGTGRLLTPAQKRNATPITKGPAKKTPNSVSKLVAQIFSGASSRENHTEDKRKGLEKSDEDRKKQPEQKSIEAKGSHQKNKPAERIDRNLPQQKATTDTANKQLNKKAVTEVKQSNIKKVMPAPEPAGGEFTFEMLHQNDWTDEDVKTTRKCHAVPTWSIQRTREPALKAQQEIPTAVLNTLFSIRPLTADLKHIFLNIDDCELRRNSSANWASPPRLEMPE